MANQLQVGPQVANDGQVVNMRGDNYGNSLVAMGCTKYQELVRRGYGFIYSQAAAGVALAAPANGSMTNLMIWNPASSGKLFIPLKISLGLVSTATVLGNIGIYGLAAAGDVAATAAPIVSYTAASPVNSLYGSGIVSSMRFAPAVENCTAAPVLIKTLGWSMLANDLASKTTWNFETDLDGQLIFKPGTAFFVAANAAVASVCVISVFGVEVPAPAGV